MLHIRLFFSGLVKPKKYDWKDSNLALFGSDTEKQVKSQKYLVFFIMLLTLFVKLHRQKLIPFV